MPLEEARLPPPTIVRAADLVVDYVHGYALAEAAGPLDPSADRRHLLAELASRPAGDLPAMRRVLGGLGEDELGADFGFGLDVILAGLTPLVLSRARD